MDLGSDKNMLKTLGNLLLLAVFVFVLFAVFTFVWNLRYMVTTPLKYTSDYQAVFLNNGQIYFGNISKDSEKEIVLEDVYYLQVNQELQTGETGQQALQNPELSLIKLGNELHAPEDKMIIMKSSVLFVEDLQDDGQVVQAIMSESETTEE